MRLLLSATILAAGLFCGLTLSFAQTWTFAVSGDSRNCGDVVMPAIARKVAADHAAFYWHLGDFRAIYDFDDDYLKTLKKKPLIITYEEDAWQDFIQNQIVPFGALTVYLGIGNHELTQPKSRPEFIQQFADWLGAPVLREQRLRDDPADHMLKTYYHWIQGGVDFITLDNASDDQFDNAQMAWLKKVLRAAGENNDVRSVVLGMHAALPDSLSAGHSMNDSAQGTKSGRELYAALVGFQALTKKPVYVLASHSHYYMSNIYNTACRKEKQQTVLPGWIVGTAGAVRYRLPADTTGAGAAQTDVYGYILGTVAADGSITFEFKTVSEKDVPQSVNDRYTPAFVSQCFTGNRSKAVIEGPAMPPDCP
jgi:hypothetical protein